MLERLVSGDPNKTIAFDLGISPRTVEIYRAHVMSKMQADSLSGHVWDTSSQFPRKPDASDAMAVDRFLSACAVRLRLL